MPITHSCHAITVLEWCAILLALRLAGCSLQGALHSHMPSASTRSSWQYRLCVSSPYLHHHDGGYAAKLLSRDRSLQPDCAPESV